MLSKIFVHYNWLKLGSLHHSDLDPVSVSLSSNGSCPVSLTENKKGNENHLREIEIS
jgi:hypothetical protein